MRSLAQRSAKAAKEIRSLISRNVEQVEQGTGLGAAAAESLKTQAQQMVQAVSFFKTAAGTEAHPAPAMAARPAPARTAAPVAKAAAPRAAPAAPAPAPKARPQATAAAPEAEAWEAF